MTILIIAMVYLLFIYVVGSSVGFSDDGMVSALEGTD